MNCAKETNNIYERPSHFVYLNTIREQNKLCDITIKVEDKEIRAHRLVLAATINFFRKIFLSEFEERKIDVIAIHNISAKNMEAIIAFSYTGTIAFTKENAASLLRDVDFFELTDVKDKCMEFLKSNFVTHNVREVYYLAKLLPGCSSLLDPLKAFIQQNLRDVSLSDDYNSLDFEFLSSILSDEDNISPQVMLEVIMRWVSNNVDKNLTYLSDLLYHVNLSELKSEFLISSLFENKFIVSLGPKHSNFVAQVLSIFNELKIKKGVRNIRTYIYVEDSKNQFTEIYNFRAKKWNLTTRTHTAPPYYNGQIFVHKGKLYRFSLKLRNELESESIENTILAYNFKDKVWIDTQLTIPFDTSRSSIAILDDYLYVCGSIINNTISECNVSTNDAWRFCFKTHTWQAISPMKQPRTYAQIVAARAHIYVIGGDDIRYNAQGSVSTAMSMEMYDPTTNEWMIIFDVDENVKSYYGFKAVELDDKIYLCGGILNNRPVTLAQAYDLKTNAWAKIASMNTASYGHLVLVDQGKIWAIGGHDINGERLSSVEVYDPNSDSWTYGKSMNRIKGLVRGCKFFVY